MTRPNYVAMAYGLQTAGTSAPWRQGRKNNSREEIASRPTRFREVCQ
jgi:hypothetical protein